MRWINYENRKPTVAVNDWPGWSEEEWQAWLKESKQLLDELKNLNMAAATLSAAGQHEDAVKKIKERNDFIDDHSGHWTKLKPWLFALSHGKCWFTEGRDICSHKDVEHFRPKKEAKDLTGSKRDGYWWLAFDYSNFRAAGNVPNRKKGGWFPLNSSSACSTFDNQCEESEAPLLLDPIDPEDVNLIAFNEEGNVVPAPGISDWEKIRVEESIERYKLNDHDALPSARRIVWNDVTNAVETYKKYKSRLGTGSNVGAAQRLREQVRKIHGFLQEDAQLSSVAKWCLLTKNDDQLTRLIS
ncbi:MAG: hypothetical protein WBB23_21885 [Desulforhopalus sp.]